MQPLAGAYVLGRARVALSKVMLALASAGHRLYYCDTDSIHTSATPAQFERALGLGCIGPALGAWKRETGPSGAVYCAPKLYWLDDGNKKAAKGVDRSKMTRDVFVRVARGERVEIPRMGIESFRASVLQGKRPAALATSRIISRVHCGKILDEKGAARYALLPEFDNLSQDEFFS